MTTKMRLLALAVAGALLPATALAGRPLASDDAGTAEEGTCQVEAWAERAGSERAWVFAPACGVAKGVELGADLALPHPRDTLRASGGLALKWVPETWRVESALGALNFGLKAGLSFDRPAGAGWQRAETSLLALATLVPGDEFAVHANLGTARAHAGGTTATLLNLALVWTPGEQALLFAEAQANNRRAVFGGTVRTAGGRWWLVKDRLGLDLSASREAGAAGTLWTLGLGWYGLAF